MLRQHIQDGKYEEYCKATDRKWSELIGHFPIHDRMPLERKLTIVAQVEKLNVEYKQLVKSYRKDNIYGEKAQEATAH